MARLLDRLLRVVLTAGCALVFLLSIGAYLTPFLLGGGKLRLLSPLIYSEMADLVDWSLGAAMSVILLIAAVAALGVARMAAGRADRRRSR